MTTKEGRQRAMQRIKSPSGLGTWVSVPAITIVPSPALSHPRFQRPRTGAYSGFMSANLRVREARTHVGVIVCEWV